MSGDHWNSAGMDTAPDAMFVCPGQTGSITRSLHLARLGAAWPGCDECEWRHHTEGLPERSVSEVVRIRQQRTEGIHRTEFGVRGAWLNALDRQIASELVRIFCLCLLRSKTPRELRGDLSGGDVTISMTSLSPVITGYDGRSFSPDLYAGITAAVTEMGFGVLDIGRTTMATMQEAIRTVPEMMGGIFVTGAGQPAAWTGIDVLDTRGESVPVVWKDFGVRLQHLVVDRDDTPLTSSMDAEQEPGWRQKLQQIRSGGTGERRSREDSGGLTGNGAVLRLIFPESTERTAWPRRLSRQSGVQRVESFEERYRNWLLRWYPEDYPARLILRADDPLIRSRIQWLSETARVSVIPAMAADQERRGAGLQSLTVMEDDRRFEWRDTNGVQVSASVLADRLNEAIGSRASHITAHSDSVMNRLWLTDAARPVSAATTERIEDSLAIAGLILRLQSQGRLAVS
jgi:hypothetical protein